MNNKKKTSKYYGVSKSGNKFYVRIRDNYEFRCIGSFSTEMEAAIEYDKALIKYNKENRRFNFPIPEPLNLNPNTKFVRLTQNKFALVDLEDYERVIKFQWCAMRRKLKDRIFYYVGGRNQENQRSIRLHTFILGIPKEGFEIDHIDGDGLNNTKENLRFVTHQQNGMNTTKQKNCTSIYKGVSWCKKREKFLVKIGFNKKRINLGYYINEEEAGRAYDTAALKYFGEYAKLNFPI